LSYLEAAAAYAYVCAIYIAAWEEYSLTVFAIVMLKRAFRHKGEEVAGRRRELHSIELGTSHFLPVLSSCMMKWELHITRMRNMKYAYNIFILDS
jgi:hypothetical protein